MPTSPQTLYKYHSESRTFSFDFSQFAELIAGDTITSITSITASPTGLTLSSETIAGSSVEVVIAGGTAQTHYIVDCLIQTSSGALLMGQGILFILTE